MSKPGGREMRRILVAVDSTEVAREATRVALDLAGRVGAQVKMVHVLPPSVAEGETEDFAAFERACEDYARGLLEELRQHTGRSGPPTSVEVLHGAPAEAISKAARAEDVDLVIVGTRARGALARTLMGSVADELLRSCPKPVMVVPEVSRKVRTREDPEAELVRALASTKQGGAPG
ncbi:universal stress protein [Archangium lansingense]|uniref:Universal stress protein n=1 Tax=Archangium lansingense TaxID=2995310 RepID=A0ABT4AMA7_9BACT|nr:universal stress protein [Archangium lansinium]MCY1082830.1 universal stress protein [Archangium lansinium]